jgi:hypothetical protein
MFLFYLIFMAELLRINPELTSFLAHLAGLLEEAHSLHTIDA